MFSDLSAQVVGFSSVSHVKRDACDSSSQTSEKHTVEQGEQASSSENVTTQTDPPNVGPVRYDEQALAEFLTRLAPLLHQELEIEADFTELEKGSADEESSLVRVATYPAPTGNTQRVSSMSWNSTGATLAVGFGVVRHDSWCDHESRVVLNNTALTRPTPPRSFNTASCVTSLHFHPVEPSVIVAGLYNGEVVVLDQRKEEPWTVGEGSGDHSGHIVQVAWCNESHFYSAGSDGCIQLRTVSFTARIVTTLERFLITRGQINSKLANRDEGLEIMAGAQLTEDSCVVGVGGGGLLHCSLSPLQPPASRPDYKNPVSQTYQAHNTIVTAIKPGPGGKTFASVSSDGQVRVYKTFEVEPRWVVNTKGCPLDIFWTDSPSVFGICGADNIVRFVRATTGQVLDLSLELTRKHAAVVTEASPRRGIVAVGDVAGNVETCRFTICK